MTAEELEDAEYEVLSPPTDLRKKVRILSKREAAKFDPVKAAEQALERLSSNFDDWMVKEADQLFEAYDTIRAEGISANNLDTLYQATHNMKGQALTLGYPLVGSVAGNFCYLLEHMPSPAKVPLALVEQHVEAIRAMVKEGARDTDNAIGAALLKKLTEVTDDYLTQFEPSDPDEDLFA